MKKLFKSKWFIIVSTITIVFLLAFLAAYALLGNDLFGGSAEILSMLADTQIHWWILGIVLVLIVFALLIMFALPFLLYVLVKISTYASLLIVCLKEKHSCKLSRLPFASIGGVSEKADIEVKMSNNKINKSPQKMVSLFAGIGGFELGFQRAGIETSMICEIDPDAQHVLAANMPNAQIVSDVCALRELPKDTDVLCAGFPCQDISTIGVKTGLSGERSSLVKEVFRLLRKRKVEWVIFCKHL